MMRRLMASVLLGLIVVVWLLAGCGGSNTFPVPSNTQSTTQKEIRGTSTDGDNDDVIGGRGTSTDGDNDDVIGGGNGGGGSGGGSGGGTGGGGGTNGG